MVLSRYTCARKARKIRVLIRRESFSRLVCAFLHRDKVRKSVCSGGTMDSWLVRSIPDRAVQVRALATEVHCIVFMGKMLCCH